MSGQVDRHEGALGLLDQLPPDRVSRPSPSVYQHQCRPRIGTGDIPVGQPTPIGEQATNPAGKMWRCGLGGEELVNGVSISAPKGERHGSGQRRSRERPARWHGNQLIGSGKEMVDSPSDP